MKTKMNDKEAAINEAINDILQLFQDQPSLRLSFGQIASRLDGKYPDPSGAVETLVEDGLLWHAGGGRYALPEALGISRGNIRIRPAGNGLIWSEDDRIEIDRGHILGALDGDMVMVRRLDPLPDGITYRGKVEAVLKRSRSGLSGVARKRGRKWVLDAVNPSLPRGIPLILPDGFSLSEGRIVFADLDYSGRRIRARAKKDLGDAGSPAVLIDSVLEDYCLSPEFPEEVSEEAREAALQPISPEDREDFRNLLTITIDPVDARDFDDAISLREEEGSRYLYVHIADVAHYTEPRGILDQEARLRGTSVYLPDRVIPMLPEILSNGACSLIPHEERYTRTVVMEFDDAGERKDFYIVPSIIRSDARMTYEEAMQYLSGEGSDNELTGLFKALGRLSSDLDRIRDARGALDLGSSEYRTVFGDDGWPDGFLRVESDASHRLIENFMIEANRAVADHSTWTGLPVMFRVHDEPAARSEEKLARQLNLLGIALPGGRIHNPAVLKRILKDLEDSPLHDMAIEYILRSLSKAIYSPTNSGHFGLSLRSYMHFTSPIRRYPDLLVHQMLRMQEAGVIPAVSGDIDQMALSTNMQEKDAEGAQRDADELMGLLYLSRNIGNSFDGVISGVAGFGVFVRLEGIPAEGLAPGGEIRRAGFHFSGSGGLFREGSSLRVEVRSVDVLNRKLTLRPLKMEDNEQGD